MSRKKTVIESVAGAMVPPPAPRAGVDVGLASDGSSAPAVSDFAAYVAPPPGDDQYPKTDVLRNHDTVEFACRQTGLFLSPGASRVVTIRDAGHHAELLDVVARFNRARPRAGRLQFDRLG